jgi:hypothetical protein
MALFTPEDLEELRRLDAEIDDDFCQTADEIRESRKRDKDVRISRLDNKQKKIAESRRAYREANREKYNAYMRNYFAARRAKQKAVSP